MNTLRWVAVVAVSVGLAACGGGGGSAGTSPFGSGSGTTTTGGTTSGGTTTSTASTVAVSLSSTTVTAGAPATVSALVKDATGAGIAGQVVTFSTTLGLGTFSSTTALTDSTGTATVSLTPTSSSTLGADTVIATAMVSGTASTGQASFQLSATTVAISNFSSDISTLGAYGQTTLTVTLSGSSGSTPVTVALVSGCASQSPAKATLTPSSVTTTTGTATFTYRDQGCGATATTDTLQASVTGTASTAPLSITLTSPTVASMTFTSASSATIYLKGSGLNETSLVTFQVRDTAGNGLPNQSVSLTPTTLTGGLTLDGGSSSITKVSDSNGNVQVRINSGTVPTPVRVKAALTSNAGVQTVSSNLSIAVGLPSQQNFSYSVDTPNIEGGDLDNVQATLQIIASDRLGNAVPDGTAINFVTSGGSVGATAFTSTTGGISTATTRFVSAAPRPPEGRAVVLAYALGEESFLDTNGNNVYDAGEDFQDLGNLYIDRLFDGVYDAATDQYISLSINSASACRTATSSLLTLDKSEPSIANTCDGVWGKAYVRRALSIVLSTSAPRAVWKTPPANLYDVNGTACTSGVVTLKTGYDTSGAASTAPFHVFGVGGYYGAPATGVISFIAADSNPMRLNPLAAGTTISAVGSAGMTVTVNGGTPVPKTTEAGYVSLGYTFASGTTSGTISVTTTTPSGVATTFSLLVTQAAPTGLTHCTQ